MRYKDIKGMKFGRLIVVEYYGADKHKNALWECQCDCGNTSIAKTHNLMKGATRSCGCLQKEKATKHLLDISTTHGLSKDSKGKNTRLFRIWMGIKNRCSKNQVTVDGLMKRHKQIIEAAVKSTKLMVLKGHWQNG